LKSVYDEYVSKSPAALGFFLFLSLSYFADQSLMAEAYSVWLEKCSTRFWGWLLSLGKFRWEKGENFY